MIIQDTFLLPYFIKAEGKQNFDVLKIKVRKKSDGTEENYNSKLGTCSSLDSALSLIVKDKLLEDKSKIKRRKKTSKIKTLNEGYVKLKSYTDMFKNLLNELRTHLALPEIN